MAIVQFYRSQTAGKAKAKSQENSGIVCFDTANGEIWLDGVLVGSSTGRILWVGRSDREDSDIKIINTDGTTDYVSIHWDESSGKALSGEVKDLAARVTALEESAGSGIEAGVGTYLSDGAGNVKQINVGISNDSSIQVDEDNKIDLLWKQY